MHNNLPVSIHLKIQIKKLTFIYILILAEITILIENYI